MRRAIYVLIFLVVILIAVLGFGANRSHELNKPHGTCIEWAKLGANVCAKYAR